MNRMNKSLMMALLMMFSSVAGIAYAPQAEAAQVIVTEAVQVVDGGGVNDRMVAMGADSQGNIHIGSSVHRTDALFLLSPYLIPLPNGHGTRKRLRPIPKGRIPLRTSVIRRSRPSGPKEVVAAAPPAPSRPPVQVGRYPDHN